MRKIKESIAKDKTYSTAPEKNKENFPAWEMSDKDRLNQLAVTGTLTNSFYSKTEDQLNESLNLLANANAEDIKDAIILGRTDGYIRAFNILGLVYLSKKDPKLFKETFDRIIITGDDLTNFIDVTNKMRGFGRSIKTAMHKWIKDKTNPYYALKYRREIADAIRISRFRGDDPIFGFILKPYKNCVKIDALKFQEAYDKYPELKAYEDVKELVNKKEFTKAAGLMKTHRLDPTSLISEYDKFNGEMWDAVAEQMSVMNFLKYINKMDAEGVFGRIGDKIYKKKITVENLKKAKVFPFRLFIAYTHINNTDIKNYIAEVLDDYVTKYDWDRFNEHSWIIAPDVSGSMTQHVPDVNKPGKNADLTPAVVAGLFSGIFYKGLKNVKMIPWSDRLHKDIVLPKSDSVISHIESIAEAKGGGTKMELAVEHMISQKLKTDIFMLITDKEEFGQGWLNYWIHYKKNINPDAIAFMLRVDSYPKQPFDDETAKEYNIYQLFGWNDNALKFIDHILKNLK